MTRVVEGYVERQAAVEGRLLARPVAPTSPGPIGLRRLGLDSPRDAWFYVPSGYRMEEPAPLMVCLHGAGGEGRRQLDHVRDLAEELGVILLAPDSRQSTWDVIRGGYGPDVLFMDRALTEVFEGYAIDPERLAVEGFSDGASYALSLGITNGDLFTDVLAYSPGFMAPVAQRGSPQIFISHGTHDTVLPIDRCSRRIVPQLKGAGYAVQYVEFEGGHTVPPEVARDAIQAFVNRRIDPRPDRK